MEVVHCTGFYLVDGCNNDGWSGKEEEDNKEDCVCVCVCVCVRA